LGELGRFDKTDRMIVAPPASASAPSGYRFPREVIAVAVRWYLRYGLSYRDVEELLGERGIEVDHVTIYRWVQTFTPELSRLHDRAGTLAVTGGSSTKPT
jgi:transposase-like protein